MSAPTTSCFKQQTIHCTNSHSIAYYVFFFHFFFFSFPSLFGLEDLMVVGVFFLFFVFSLRGKAKLSILIGNIHEHKWNLAKCLATDGNEGSVYVVLGACCCGLYSNMAIGNVLMCVCHCADSWKNFTPYHSVPSMLTEEQVTTVCLKFFWMISQDLCDAVSFSC